MVDCIIQITSISNSGFVFLIHLVLSLYMISFEGS